MAQDDEGEEAEEGALAEGEREDYSRPGSKPVAKLWGPKVPYSNQIANGDRDDDRELEDEDDPQDHIADDNGFSKTFKISGRKISEWERRQRMAQVGKNRNHKRHDLPVQDARWEATMGDEVDDSQDEMDNSMVMIESKDPASAKDPAKWEEESTSGEQPSNHFGFADKAEESHAEAPAQAAATPALAVATAAPTAPATQEAPKEAAKVEEPAPIVAVQAPKPDKASISKEEKADMKKEKAKKAGEEARIAAK